MLTVQNVVGTGSVGCPLNISEVARKLPHVTYNPRRFSGASLKVQKCTVLLFRTGKIVLAGGKTLKDCKASARATVHLLQEIGYPQATYCEIIVQNMVGAGHAGGRINLNSLHSLLLPLSGHRPSYEPELFPGLINRMAENFVTATVFTSGKINIVGGKSEEQIRKAYDELLPLLSESYIRVP